MPLSLDLRPHDVKTTNTGERVAIVSAPYLRLANGNGPPVFVQRGKFFCEGGPQLSEAELPDWVDEELAKLSDAVRKEVGLV